MLLVFRGSIDPSSIRRRCAAHAGVARTLAICHVLAAGEDGFLDGLKAQQAITAAMREALGPTAEEVAVFVATAREGEVDECARQWGATEVDA